MWNFFIIKFFSFLGRKPICCPRTYVDGLRNWTVGKFSIARAKRKEIPAHWFFFQALAKPLFVRFRAKFTRSLNSVGNSIILITRNGSMPSGTSWGATPVRWWAYLMSLQASQWIFQHRVKTRVQKRDLNRPLRARASAWRVSTVGGTRALKVRIKTAQCLKGKYTWMRVKKREFISPIFVNRFRLNFKSDHFLKTADTILRDLPLAFRLFKMTTLTIENYSPCLRSFHIPRHILRPLDRNL